MIETLHLFRPLNQKLIELLKGLSLSDWLKKTVAGHWLVKDVAAHLLDGNIRLISSQRDQIELRPEEEINGYEDIVNYLNRINGEWVKAMKRVGPSLLIEWLSNSHEGYISGLEKLDLLAPAKFSVAWAGDDVSPNWFHIAREFTEKWHHHQQIRDAVNQPGILTQEFYRPVLDTFMRALPYKYKDVSVAIGTRILISVADMGDPWLLEKRDHQWVLNKPDQRDCTAMVTIPKEISWKLFTKALRYEDVKNSISITGDEKLAKPVLNMIAVMA